MVVFNQREMCKHNIAVKLRSGSSIINSTPVISYDSRYVIIACGSNIRVFTIMSGECIQTLKYHSRPVISIRENKKNNLQLFSCSEDGVVVRWDYIDGKILQVYNLKMAVTNFYVPTASGPWFVSKPFQDQYRLYSLVPEETSSIKTQLILKPVQPKENSISFGFMGKFCASILKNVLSIYKFKTKNIIRHMTGERNLTCVVCHPSDFVLATGDDHGRVVLWTNALDSNQPIRSIYHWHTLPVSDLVFSSEGTHLHSGGGEAALVKWNLFSEEKLILPRMGAPIVHLCCSKDNSYVVTTHSDNVLQVVNAQRNVVQVIQGLTRSNPQNTVLLPTGLLYNAYLKTIVMNGKPGHLQFYDIIQDKQLFNLDIAGKNYISQERDTTVFNMDVQKAAVDESGLWLATAEYWSNDDTSPQIWLKFWMFDLQKQAFVLNTNVILPHNKQLNCILFQPQVNEASPLAATTSSDGRFKIWTLSDNSSDKKQSWGCDSMGCYRDLPAGSACFSEEGSLLAVAFKSAVTLWTVKGTALKAVLCNEKNKINIKQLVFGRHSCCSYLVCQDGVSITVWNVLTLSIAWIVHTDVDVLAGDMLSSNVAAFCRDQSLIIFNPDDPNPLHTFEKISETPVLSAVFVPSTQPLKEEATCFHDNSQLYFVNETQNLFTVSESEPEEEIISEKTNIVQKVMETPFGMLQAAQKVSDVKKNEEKQMSISISKLGETECISNPILQNPIALCSMILPSLLIPAKKKSCTR